MRKQKYKSSVELTPEGQKRYAETDQNTGVDYTNPSSTTGLRTLEWVTTFPFTDGSRTPTKDFQEDDFDNEQPVSIIDFAKALGVSRTRANQILQSGKVVSVWRGDNELSQFIFGDIEKGKQEYFKARRAGYKARASAGGKAKAQRNRLTNVSSATNL